MGILWSRSSSLEWDDNGVLAEGALAYFYEAGTSTPKAVYSNGGESTAHEFPVEADGGRWPAVFIPFGSYKVIIKTAGGTTLFSADDVPNEAPNDTEVTVDEDALYQTGDYIFVGKNGTRSGAVRCNGRTIGDASSAGTERANADCADLFAYLWNNYANGQAAVSTGRGATAVADFAAHKTIALPDHRGSHLIGFDDMGSSNSAQLSGITATSGSSILAGSILGGNYHPLTIAELPVVTPAGTLSTSAVTGTAAAQAFTGTNATITATGTNAASALTGGTTAAISRFPTGAGGGANDYLTTAGTGSTTTYAVTGTAAAQTFTGSGVSYTPAGTNATSAVTGTAAAQTFTGTPFGSGNNIPMVTLSTPVTILMKL